MAMKVKEVAELASISVRTLHHYDEIGLLTPDEVTSAGYRLYSDANLERLQQILFFKELDFSLKEIKNIITNPSFNPEEALKMHRLILLEKRQRLDQMIATIDRTVLHVRGEIKMTAKEQFEGFDFSQNPYEQEARERWGDHAVDHANQKLHSKSTTEQKALSRSNERNLQTSGRTSSHRTSICRGTGRYSRMVHLAESDGKLLA